MPKKSEQPPDDGRYAYGGLERAMHEKGRLAIMTSLMTHPRGLLFGELKRMTAITDGNLSRHVDTLREAELVEVWKGYEGRRPQTLVRLTAEGRQRFIAYLAELAKVIRDARAKQAVLDKQTTEALNDPPPGWIPA